MEIELNSVSRRGLICAKPLYCIIVSAGSIGDAARRAINPPASRSAVPRSRFHLPRCFRAIGKVSPHASDLACRVLRKRFRDEVDPILHRTRLLEPDLVDRHAI